MEDNIIVYFSDYDPTEDQTQTQTEAKRPYEHTRRLYRTRRRVRRERPRKECSICNMNFSNGYLKHHILTQTHLEREKAFNRPLDNLLAEAGP